MRNLFLLIIIAASCASCGWQLRGMGQGQSPSEFTRPDHLRLTFMERNSNLEQPIRQQMARLKITLDAEAAVALVIEKEQMDKRPLAVTDTGVTAQYQLMYSVSYYYQDKQGNPLHPSRKVVSWRNYDFDPQLMVAKAQEEKALIAEMRDELAQRILGASF